MLTKRIPGPWISVLTDIDRATESLAKLKEVVSDMRYAGMDTTKNDTEIDRLDDEIRKLKIFYNRQAKKA
ncbi:hypothetical protein LCGC14_3065430 [marine sediment metagenome]|uniref:Uncharacterized protein n=1 Tax=marine sediment metagenome TaxID=412755 RepID=A0A0F8WIB5_9ZZZZ